MNDFFSNKLIDSFEQMLENNKVSYFDSSEYIEIIEYYLDISDLEYAYKALLFAISQHPDNRQLNMKQLEYFVDALQFDNAIILLEELKSTHGNTTDYLICQAKYLAAKGRHKKAIKCYLKAIDNLQELEYLHNCIGNEYIEINLIEKALYHFQQVLHYDPKDEYAFYSCIFCYDELYKPLQCIEFIQQYIDINPYSEAAWFQLGIKYIQEKLYKEAYQAFDFAYAINPLTVVNYLQKAECLEKLGYWNEAIAVYTEAIPIEDNPSYVWQKIGSCYTNMEEPIKALTSLKQACKADPESENVWHTTAKIHELLQQPKEALYCINKALKLDSDNIQFLKTRVFILAELGLYEETILDLKSLLQLEPHNFKNHYAYAEFLLSVGEMNTAIQFLHKSIIIFQRAELYYLLSYAYFFVSEKDKGKEHLENAISLNPKLQKEMTSKYPILKDSV